MDFMGGIGFAGFEEEEEEEAAAAAAAACFAVSEEPVSIWTTCLNEVVSAWTNVVGYEFAGSDLVKGFGILLLLLLLFS